MQINSQLQQSTSAFGPDAQANMQPPLRIYFLDVYNEGSGMLHPISGNNQKNLYVPPQLSSKLEYRVIF